MVYTRLAHPKCHNCCSCCVSPLPQSWTIDFSDLGLVNGSSCNSCSQFNGVYVLTSNASAPSQWDWFSGLPPFFCRPYEPTGDDLWNGIPYYSDAVAFVGYAASCKLTRTPLPALGCLWEVDWFIASAMGYYGDDPGAISPANKLCLNWARWQARSFLGEDCAKERTLKLVNSNIDGWVDRYAVSGGDGTFNDIGKAENAETGEGTFVSIGAMCADGPHFGQTITITPS